MCCVSTVHCVRRPHATQDSNEAFYASRVSSRSCDITRGRRRLRYRDCLNDGADRLRALARQFVPATMLVPVRLGLHFTATPNTADCLAQVHQNRPA